MKRLIALLVAAGFVGPVIASYLRRSDGPGVAPARIRGVTSQALILDDPVKTATTGFDPDAVWRWYEDYLGSKAAKVDMEVRPCTPIDCPPEQEFQLRSFADMLHDWMADLDSQSAIAIDTACQQAIQTGFMGVRVTRRVEERPDAYVMIVEAQATPDVPYGHIQGDYGPPQPMGIIGFEP